jgi:hypothetical protein
MAGMDFDDALNSAKAGDSPEPMGLMASVSFNNEFQFFRK